MGKNLKYGIIAVIVIGIIMTGVSALNSYISVRDTNVRMNANYDQLINNRSSAYDAMRKTIKETFATAKIVDTSYSKIAQIMMDGQKDGANLTWKWVQQSNPLTTFNEVSSMYKNLTRLIEGERKTIVEKERLIGLLVAEQEILLKSFWASFFFGDLPLLKDKYKPITSSAMEEINRTSKDDESLVQ